MAEESEILYARPSPDYVVFRVIGRGTFQNSFTLKRTALRMRKERPGLRYIMDLENCASMDSTFMGVLASLGLGKRREGLANLAIVNVNDHARRLLETLGLSHFLEVRQTPALESDESAFQRTEEPVVTKREQILHMIEAHQELIDIDNHNRIRFESVMAYLSESLEQPDSQELDDE